ncbi:carboxymuconolactone decarboxylase family protein [Mycobacterium sp.]|uniref:carboxymuconolactone decarboxylase family protein n=1 Tax=Mycobacterium sp. TaxID=1785 RepID=UPI0031E39128
MSRIPLAPVEQQPAPIREFMARRGALNVFRVLANAPDVFVGWTQMVDELFDSPTFTLRTRELVILRVARLQNSRYQLSQHIDIARDAGLTEQQIGAIVETDEFDDFDDEERMLLDVVTELCSTHRLSDASFSRARDVFGDEGLTELLMLVSCYYGLALVLNAVDVEVDAR